MYYVVVNPNSRSGKGQKYWNMIKPVLDERQVSYQVIFSNYTGHIKEIVAKLLQTENATKENPIDIILLGGDGTLNEAVQGIDDFDKIRIGYIPTGSSNDLARDLSYEKDPIALLSSILEGCVKRKMDIGLVKSNGPTPYSRRFVVSCGIGFDAAVCEQVQRTGSKALLNRIGLGKLTYLAIALKNLYHTKTNACSMRFDEQAPVSLPSFFFIASMIHRYEGGGFMFCPDADYQDGILDFCVVGNLKKLSILRILPTAYKGKHLRFQNIDAYRGMTLHLTCEKPLWVHTDGEVNPQSNSLTISSTTEKLQFLA